MAKASSNTDLISSDNKKKVIWFWRSNSYPRDENESSKWKRYSDFENEFIENAFQQQAKEVQLNGYVINFQYLIAFKNGDRSKQISVKREEVELHNYLREERFAYPDRALKSFDSRYEQEDNFVWQWRKKNEHIAVSGRYNYPAIAQAAIQGILEEGKLLNREFDAERIAEKLSNAKTEEDICRCAAHLYSAESFLYKSINLSLRNHDMSKVDTLGAFCHLLWRHLYSNNNSHEQTLYRGTTLTNEMIDEYKQALGTRISWPAFTSTSKDRHVAEIFSGNTLFIISMVETKKERSDISSISYYPDEQEVLLPQHSDFQIEAVEHDAGSEHYSIYMKALS